MEIGSEEWEKIIIEGAKHFNLQVGPEEAEQFSKHAAELVRWNLKTNLTAITDPKEIAVKHVIDSLAPARVIPAFSSMIDIGSGGGFPGIPLKILMPSLSVSLIDSSRKKVSFLKHIIRSLKLVNIDAFQVRAEDLDEKKERFDVVICRAFSSLDKFIQLTVPILSENGIIIALKGKISNSEMESAGLSGKGRETGKSLYRTDIIKYRLPYTDSERAMIIIKKDRL